MHNSAGSQIDTKLLRFVRQLQVIRKPSHFTYQRSWRVFFSRRASTARGAPSPLVILGIAALNVSAAVLWHHKLTVAFIKQEMKRGRSQYWNTTGCQKDQLTAGAIVVTLDLSRAHERASQLSAWWICVNAVSSWTAQRAGVAGSSRRPLHSVGRPVLPQCHGAKWVLIVASAGVIAASSSFFSSGYIKALSVKPLGIMALSLTMRTCMTALMVKAGYGQTRLVFYFQPLSAFVIQAFGSFIGHYRFVFVLWVYIQLAVKGEIKTCNFHTAEQWLKFYGLFNIGWLVIKVGYTRS